MRRVSGLVSMSIVLAAVGGCGLYGLVPLGFAQPTGTVDVCFNRSSLAQQDDFSIVADETGLRPVTADDDVVAAPDGIDCTDADAHVELVTPGSEHLWLGVSATHHELSIVPATLFAGLGTDVHVRVNVSQVWSRSATVLVEDNGAPVVALQQSSVPADDLGLVHVVFGGASGPPMPNGCGTEQMLSIDFTHDGGVHSLWNEHNTALSIDGNSFVATNIFSADYVATNCEDTPSGPETTWVLVRDDLVQAE